MNISVQGKRAVITAGGAGMGRSTALAMPKLGAQVFTCDIDVDALSTLPKGIETFICDVSDSAQIDAMLAQILPNGLDILVNNAGIGGPTNRLKTLVMKSGVSAWGFVLTRNSIVFEGWCLFLKNSNQALLSLGFWRGLIGVSEPESLCCGKMGGNGFCKNPGYGIGAR